MNTFLPLLQTFNFFIPVIMIETAKQHLRQFPKQSSHITPNMISSHTSTLNFVNRTAAFNEVINCFREFQASQQNPACNCEPPQSQNSEYPPPNILRQIFHFSLEKKMHLLDNYEAYDNLTEPLIETPISTSDIDDIYIAEDTELEQRWRPYIRVEDWHPEKHHHHILARRAWYARQVWELIILIGCAEPNYLMLPTLEELKAFSTFKLRKAEYELMSFQLTCGMLGVGSKNQKDLYLCCCIMFITNMFILEKFLSKMDQTVDQKKQFSACVRSKPLSTDSCKNLGKQIDRQIFMTFLLLGNVQIPKKYHLEVGGKLKECILAFDKVAVIIE